MPTVHRKAHVEVSDKRTDHAHHTSSTKATADTSKAKAHVDAPAQDVDFKPGAATKKAISTVPFEPTANAQFLPAIAKADAYAKKLGFDALTFRGTGVMARSLEVTVNSIEHQQILLHKGKTTVELGTVLPEAGHMQALKSTDAVFGEVKQLVDGYLLKQADSEKGRAREQRADDPINWNADPGHDKPSIDVRPSRSGNQLNLHVTLEQLASAKTVSKDVKEALADLGVGPKAAINIAKHLVESKEYGKYKDHELTFNLGGIPQPGYVDVGIGETGFSLPFEAKTGEPMGESPQAHAKPSVDVLPSRSGNQLNLHVTLEELAGAKTVSKEVKKALADLGLEPKAAIAIAAHLTESKKYGKYKDHELTFNLGGIPQPGYVDVGIGQTGFSLPFKAQTGEPMGGKI